MELEQLTFSVTTNLNQLDFEQMQQFVEDRQLIVDEMNIVGATSQLTHEQSGKLANILKNDVVISQRMESLKEEAGSWLLQRQAAKSQRGAYEASYTPDSILMDYRK